MKILLIEGDRQFSTWLEERLRQAGFRLVVSKAGADPARNEDARNAAAIVVDEDQPNGSAAHIVRRMRSCGHDAPLLVISGTESWREKVRCLDDGADDYLVKPVRSEEIAARLRAMVRRSAGRSFDRISIGPLAVDMKARAAWIDGDPLDLTRNEFRLLAALVMRPDKVYTPEEIRQLTKHPGGECSNNAVEVLVARLRRKVGRDTIRTQRGVGYRLSPELEQAEGLLTGSDVQRQRA